MATTFPTSLQALTNVTDNVDYPEASTVNNLNDTVEALESKVGVTGSAVSTSHDYIIKNKIWPVGCVFIAVVPTNPATLTGLGSAEDWTQIAGGQMLVGQTDGDADFNVAEETGGAKTKTIAKANLPNISTGAGTAHTHTQNSHYHGIPNGGGTSGSGYSADTSLHDHADHNSSAKTATNQNESAHTHSLGGSGTAMDVVNPYLVVYIWKRTA